VNKVVGHAELVAAIAKQNVMQSAAKHLARFVTTVFNYSPEQDASLRSA
jgi:hypothetical protein